MNIRLADGPHDGLVMSEQDFNLVRGEVPAFIGGEGRFVMLPASPALMRRVLCGELAPDADMELVAYERADGDEWREANAAYERVLIESTIRLLAKNKPETKGNYSNNVGANKK